MKIYKLQGIHCRGCGDRLESKLQKLQNGQDVKIDYETNELILPEEMDEERIKMILAQEKIMAFPKESLDENHHKHLDKRAHEHNHNHNHFNGADQSVKNIRIVFFLNLFFSILEVIFGLMFNSVAILSDAIHDFGDSVSVGLSWFFQKYAQKEPSNRFSFGHQRFSLMGALITATVLLLGSLLLLTRSFPRLFQPEAVNEEGMLYLSIFAIALNGYAAWLLSKGSSKNEKVLNVHMLEDVLGWIGVFIVSILLRYTNWYILDPILSVFISLFIFTKTLPLFISTMHIFLEGVPPHVDLDRLEADILKIQKVHVVSHLHIWSIDGEENAMNVTLFVSTSDPMTLEQIKDEVRFLTRELRVSHSTIEIITDIHQFITKD